MGAFKEFALHTNTEFLFSILRFLFSIDSIYVTEISKMDHNFNNIFNRLLS